MTIALSRRRVTSHVAQAVCDGCGTEGDLRQTDTAGPLPPEGWLSVQESEARRRGVPLLDFHDLACMLACAERVLAPEEDDPKKGPKK